MMKFLKLIKKIFKVTTAVAYLSWGILVLITTRNLKPVYRGLRFFLEHESYQITLRKLLADPKTQSLIQQRYRQGKPVEWNRLRQMAPGTLGYEFSKFMNNPDVTPLEKLPEANSEINPDIDYIRQRIRLIHDIHHVVCGLPADELGEMGISAFYVAQVNSPLNSMLLGVGFFKRSHVWIIHKFRKLVT